MLIPEEGSRFDPRKYWLTTYRLGLWCEEPGAEHLVGEPYSFRRPKPWFADIAPYLRLAARTLTMVSPVAAGVAALTLGSESVTARSAELMTAIADIAARSVPIADAVSSNEGLGPSGGAAVRLVRQLLLELDPARQFAGLRRVLSPAGDYLWLCEQHYRSYEPTLPQLPYSTR